MRRILTTVILLLMILASRAQRVTPEQYILKFKDIAIAEMKRMGIPAAITLAQGILEAESGNSDLVKRSNNHFGIKCKNTWTGEVVYHNDDENGECFRAYKSAEESYRDHSNFLRGSARYGFLFNLDAADYRGWAYGLKKAGYATNPQYPSILIRNIEQYNLQQYTLAGMSELPVFRTTGINESKADTLQTVSAPVNDVVDTAISVSILDMPLKEILINQRKCVMAPKGMSFLLIAARNNIPLEKLLQYNELAEDGILGKSQFVFLEKKSKVGELEYWIVQPGETLYDIAQKNGIQLQYLLDYNKLGDAGRPEAGTRLTLRPVKKETPANRKTGSIRYHEVAAREGLYAISRKYKVPVEQLREWNKLESDDLRIGQKLIVFK